MAPLAVLYWALSVGRVLDADPTVRVDKRR